MQSTFHTLKKKQKLDIDAKIDRAFGIAYFFSGIMVGMLFIMLITPISKWQHNQLNSLPTQTVLYSC